ncbi:CRISPR-associated endonuclease Cas3'' [Streptomyces sp. NBC_00589]|uniref:CRISPR-associated endonuclease Cas3'' n=1 Tax=Streptomyces sp. NBC_00589 TaxID=2975785 RepID=UPI003FCDE4C4
MEDSAAVAGLLWDNWVPTSLRGLIAESLPGGETDARCLVVWLAAVHDIGKATPAFACQVDELADRMRAEGLEMRTARGFGPDRRMAPHGLAGQLLFSEWLESRGWTGRQAGQLTIVVGGGGGSSWGAAGPRSDQGAGRSAVPAAHPRAQPPTVAAGAG